MQSFVIRNKIVQDILEEYRYNYFDRYDVSKACKFSGENEKAEKWVSDEYLNALIATGRKHNGFPNAAKCYHIKPSNCILSGEDKIQFSEDWFNIDTKIRLELGCLECPLSAVYPPTGFIDWHNNANQPCYVLIFTWSETGDGWFKWYDFENEKIMTIPDQKGWSLKAGYFGTYDEHKVCYHSAYTDCWRMTQSFDLGLNYDWWKDCLIYISEGR